MAFFSCRLGNHLQLGRPMNESDGITQRLAALEEKVEELEDELRSISSRRAKDGGARSGIQTLAQI